MASDTVAEILASQSAGQLYLTRPAVRIREIIESGGSFGVYRPELTAFASLCTFGQLEIASINSASKCLMGSSNSLMKPGRYLVFSRSAISAFLPVFTAF